MKRLQAFHLGWGIAVGIVLLFLPMLVRELRIHIAVEILIYALFAISFNLLAGYGGMLPFGHATLFGVGAYATALICNNVSGTPLLLALLIATMSSVFVGAIVGFFCIRLKGAYFALLSFAFQMFLFAVASKWRDVTNGADGMGVTRPDLYLPGLVTISLRSITNFYYFTLVLTAIGIFVCYLFLKTPMGNSLICMREQEVRASFLGYNVFLTKLAVFSGSGILAGLAGGLFVLFQKYVNTGVVDMNTSMTVLLMATIGGSGHFLGPVLGAAFYVIFQDWISSLTDHWWILLGIVFIVTGLYRPSRGRIYFLDKDITHWSVHKIARIGLSRSFQIINIFPMMTVYENVRNAIVSKFNRRFKCITFLNQDKEIELETYRVIDLLALGDLQNVLASELSYGRQRHLELALTVARDPILIMLDEPTAGLNSEETRNAVQLIKQVTDGKTLAMVEHDMEVVFNLADRITVLNNGKILATGSPDEIRENVEVKKAYLGRK